MVDWTAPQAPVGTNTVLRNGSAQPEASQGLSGGQKLSIFGDAISGVGSYINGVNALSSAKINAKLQRQAGNDAFRKIMGDTKQAAGSYQTVQGASGVISQSAGDVKRAGMSTGIKDAVTAKLNYDMEAVNSIYKGKMAKAEGMVGAGTSLMSISKTMQGL